VTDLTIAKFCAKHNACISGRVWALENCNSMQDAWKKLPWNYLTWTARQSGVLTDMELRRYAIFCARQVQSLMEDQRSVHAIDVAEKFLNGTASKADLKQAQDEAREARAAAAAADAAAAAAAADADAAAAAAYAAAAYAAAAYAAAAADAAAAAAYAAYAAAAAAYAAAAAADAAAADAAYAAAAAAAAADAAAAAAADADAAAAAAVRQKVRAAQCEWLRANTKPNFT